MLVVGSVRVWAGSLEITNSTLIVPQNIAIGVPSQMLGGLEAEVSGEPVSVSEMTFIVSTTGNGLINNVTIVDENGLVAAGPVDAVQISASCQKLVFTDTIVFPIGKHVYALKGKIPTSFGNGETLSVSTTPSSDWKNARGQITGELVDLSSVGLVTMSTMTARGPTLTVRQVARPSETIIPGAQGVTFAEFDLDAAESSEDIRNFWFPLFLTLAEGAEANWLINGQMFDGTVPLNTGSNTLNPKNGGELLVPFDQPFVVPKGTKKRLVLKFNVFVEATGAYAFSSGTNFSAVGVTSGQSAEVEMAPAVSSFVKIYGTLPGGHGISSFSIEQEKDLSIAFFTITNTTIDNQYQVQESTDLLSWQNVGYPQVAGEKPLEIKLAVGTNHHAFYRIAEMPPRMLSVALSPGSPPLLAVESGTRDVTVGKFRVCAAFQPIRLNMLSFQMSVTEGGHELITAGVVSIWNGSTKVAEASVRWSDKTVIALLPLPRVIVDSGECVEFTAKVDLGPINALETSVSGKRIGISHYEDGEFKTTGTGLVTGEEIIGTGMAVSPGVLVFRSVPKLALIPLQGEFSGTLMRLRAKGNATRDYTIGKLSFLAGSAETELTDVGLFVDGQKFQLEEIPSTQPGMKEYRTQSSIRILANSEPIIELQGNAVDKPSITEVMVARLLVDNIKVLDVAPKQFGELALQSKFIWTPHSVKPESLPSDPDWFDGSGLPELQELTQVTRRPN